MLRQYNVAGNCVNTASTTLPLGNLVGGTTVMTELTEFNVSSDAVASNAAKYAFQRGTTAGTWGGAGGAAITPACQGPVTVASVTAANQGVCSVGPTLTAGVFLYQFALNQQSAERWVQNPGYGMHLLQASGASLNLMSLVAAVAFNTVFSFVFNE